MKKTVYGIIKKSEPLRKLARALYFGLKRILYLINTAFVKTQPKTVFFCSFNGKAFSDSPKQLYLDMLASPDFSDYEFIWGFEQPDKHTLPAESKNTVIVRTHSAAYEKALKKSGVWITNFRIGDYFIPSKKQRYIQCWHGTPLKKLGYDIDRGNNALNSVSEIKGKYLEDAKKFTHIISPSPFTTQKLISAFNLKALGKEDSVIEEGYPRNDFLYRYTPGDVSQIKREVGVPEDKRVILYAPTWRDNQHISGVGYSYKTEIDFDRLRSSLPDNYVLLFRAHYFVANSFDFERYKGFVYNVSDYDDIARLYVISDMLITDYSSVFFDYANLSRPIIFYMYDLEQYRGQIRDFYFPPEELPGEIVTTQEQLTRAVIEYDKGFTPDLRYTEFKKRFNPLDDGNASHRTLARIFYNRDRSSGNGE